MKYRKPYSTIFIVVAGIVVVEYLMRNFIGDRREDKYIIGEFDEG